jgi:hypothetical protein
MGELLRAEQHAAYYWKSLARRLAQEHAREIAETLFDSHGRNPKMPWLLRYSRALDVLDLCIKADPQGVWEELAQQFEKRRKAYIYTIGFPDDIIERLPREAVLSWVALRPEARAPLLARLIQRAFVEGSLGVELLNRYGHLDAVSSAFFSAWISGSFAGALSEHWEELAETLERTAAKSLLPGIRKWSKDTIRELRKMAARDRKREEEERIRW